MFVISNQNAEIEFQPNDKVRFEAIFLVSVSRDRILVQYKKSSGCIFVSGDDIEPKNPKRGDEVLVDAYVSDRVVKDNYVLLRIGKSTTFLCVDKSLVRKR